MPSIILVNESTGINLDNVNMIQIHGLKPDSKPDDPARIDVAWANNTTSQLEVTCEDAMETLVMTQVCSGLAEIDDYDGVDPDTADGEFEHWCMHCEHLDDDRFCSDCLHNFDDDLEPTGTEDNFDLAEDDCLYLDEDYDAELPDDVE